MCSTLTSSSGARPLQKPRWAPPLGAAGRWLGGAAGARLRQHGRATPPAAEPARPRSATTSSSEISTRSWPKPCLAREPTHSPAPRRRAAGPRVAAARIRCARGSRLPPAQLALTQPGAHSLTARPLPRAALDALKKAGKARGSCALKQRHPERRLCGGLSSRHVPPTGGLHRLLCLAAGRVPLHTGPRAGRTCGRGAVVLPLQPGGHNPGGASALPPGKAWSGLPRGLRRCQLPAVRLSVRLSSSVQHSDS